MDDAHSSTDTPFKTTRTGRCNCGAVRFEAECDTRTGNRCNCSICTRLGVLTGTLKPADVRVLAGEENLTGWKVPIGTRYFCKTCGIQCFARGYLKEIGGDYATVNYLTLDGFDPSGTRVLHWDGRHDNWKAGTREEPWPLIATLAG